jgi:DNA-binding NarL/FixJ family response regulator
MKVLLVDDNWVCRAGLKPLLSQINGKVEVLEAVSFDEALELAAKNSDLSLVVLDLLSPSIGSLDMVRELLDKLPKVTLVTFSQVENRHDVLRAIEFGAAGYIPKNASGEEIVKALELVLSGEIYLPRMLLKEAPRQEAESASFMPTDAAPRQAISNLTARQRQVLGFLAQGMTNTKIAKQLGLSENTVRIHISAILRTLDLDNRTQAALLAAEYLRGPNTSLTGGEHLMVS